MLKKKSILLLLLIFVFAFTACAPGGDTTDSTDPDDTTTATDPETESPDESDDIDTGTEPLTLPIVDEPLTVTFWCTLGRSTVSLTNFDEMAAYIELQERTGIDIEFIHPTVGSESEQFNLLLVSGDLPDLIEWGWTNVPGGPASYVADGTILPLNDPIKKWAPNLQQVFSEHPQAKVEAMLDDGTFYFFPGIYDIEHRHWHGPTIRSDMMDDFGIEGFPETIDEWYEMLTKVRQGSDEIIPFSIRGKAQWDQTHLFLGAWGIRSDFYQVDGEVRYGPLQPEYGEFLEEMAKWYAEGLIDPEFPANDKQMADAKNSQNLIFSQASAMGGDITLHTSLMRREYPDFTMHPVKFPVLNKGDEPAVGFSLPMVYGGGTVITTACENVREVTKLMDYNYSKDGELLGNFGIEGLSYELVDGEPIYTDLIMDNPDGYDIASAISVYAYHSGNTALWKPGSVVNQRDSLPEQLEGRQLWINTTNENLIPRVYPTPEEGTEFAAIMSDVNVYSAEMFVAFITGERPTSEFPDFVDTLINDFRIERAIEIMQSQLDRFAAREELAKTIFD